MHRIDTIDATSDNRFTEGNPTIPVPATTVSADWLNAVQEELVAVLAAAKIAPAKADNSQLLAALRLLTAAPGDIIPPDGTTIKTMNGKLAVAYGTVANTACQGNDSRLGNARTPTAHKATHATGGADALTPAAIGAAAVQHATPAATTSAVGHVKLNSAVNSTSVTEAATPSAVKAAYDKAVAAGFLLCEFYFFRHPSLRPGFQPAQGGLLANAATLYPEAWAYLQTVEGRKLCTTEAEWQAMTTATWATLVDGSTVGWNGIGGAPYYAPNTATGALRLPDLRGMYAEAAGFDALGVGGAHGDGIREIIGYINLYHSAAAQAGGAFELSGLGNALPGEVNFSNVVSFVSSRMVPVANKNQPRAWGSLACVYLGTPK